MGRPVTPKTVDMLARIIQRACGKFILKGVMTVEDARLAVDAGADALVVSNHGGRVLEDTPATAEVLPDISAAVKGKITILADGGVRTGGDVLKLLALGADAVMIGRPFSVAAVGGLQKGVELYIDKIRTELEQAMVLTGVSSVTSVSGAILHHHP
jgi:isopentenyl diphosphate isomerase/L-lactate dehydrogenase-like FMN-dependent dehydrogenase